MPREFLLVTPFQVLAGFGVWLLAICAALGLGWWLRGAELPEPAEVEASEDSVTPVDLRPRRRARPPKTGTFHAAHLPASDDSPTQVFRLPGGGLP